MGLIDSPNVPGGGGPGNRPVQCSVPHAAWFNECGPGGCDAQGNVQVESGATTSDAQSNFCQNKPLVPYPIKPPLPPTP